MKPSKIIPIPVITKENSINKFLQWKIIFYSKEKYLYIQFHRYVYNVQTNKPCSQTFEHIWRPHFTLCDRRMKLNSLGTRLDNIPIA